MQRVVVISYRHFSTTYQSHPQDFMNPKFWMQPIGCAKTLVRNYHYSLCNNAEKQSSHQLHGRNLKSCLFNNLFTLTLVSVKWHGDCKSTAEVREEALLACCNLCGRTIKFTNTPPCAYRDSTGQKP